MVHFMRVDEFEALASTYINSFQTCLLDSFSNKDGCLRNQIEFQDNVINLTSTWYRKIEPRKTLSVVTLEDDLLAADPSVIPGCNGLIDTLITIKTDVLLHPIYGIPCPYITGMWTDNGGRLNIEEAQMLIDELNGTNCDTVMNVHEKHETDLSHFLSEELPLSTTTTTTTTSIPTTDHRQYTFGRLTMEIHPITDSPCWSFHICQLTDIMELRNLNRSSLTPTTSTDIQHDGSLPEPLYLLNWFTVIGPYFAYKLSPGMYNKLAQLIGNRNK